MLGFVFGFNARLGRLHYVLATIGLAVVTTALCVALASQIYNGTPHGVPLSLARMAWSVIGIAIIFLLASFSLQCMRIRDIGWDPVCVMPMWIAILIIDHLVAKKFPAFALDADHNGTIVAGMLNLGMFLALIFWPGAEYIAGPPSFALPSRQPDPPPRQGNESAASSRIARVTNGEFGRRSG